MRWMGWTFGFVEAICAILASGFSIDFVVHLALALREAPRGGSSHLTRCRQAVDAVGGSLVSSAISTALAAILLSGSELLPFHKFGAYMAINVLVTLAVTLGPFLLLLLRFGSRFAAPPGSLGGLAEEEGTALVPRGSTG